MERMCQHKVQESRDENIFTVRESSQIDNSKYYHFNKSHEHNTNKCIHLKNAIKGLTKKGRLSEYTKDDKKDQDDSPKSKKSLDKTINVMNRGK